MFVTSLSIRRVISSRVFSSIVVRLNNIAFFRLALILLLSPSPRGAERFPYTKEYNFERVNAVERRDKPCANAIRWRFSGEGQNQDCPRVYIKGYRENRIIRSLPRSPSSFTIFHNTLLASSTILPVFPSDAFLFIRPRSHWRCSCARGYHTAVSKHEHFNLTVARTRFYC